LFALGSRIDLEGADPLAREYMEYVHDIISNPHIQEMKQYFHHGNTTCFQHCLNVSYYNFIICKLLSWDARSAARAGLMHDMFLYDWHTKKFSKGEKGHATGHAITALNNASSYFELNPIEKDIILKHMFPVTTTLPCFKETLIIILTDKYCGLIETVAPRLNAIWHFLTVPIVVNHTKL